MTTRIGIAGLGGTIAMKPARPGEPPTPGLSADDLVAAVPGLADVAEFTTTQIANVGSPSVTLDHLLDTLDWAREQVAGGAAGIVLTHGTDTLEESAFLLDLLWDRDEPLVLTGAMRTAGMAGADGPANLLAAVQTAASDDARGLGVLTCLNDTVHLAARATKSASMSVETFASPGTGPVGYVVEGAFRPRWRPVEARRAPLAVPSRGTIAVPLIGTGLDDDGSLLRLVAGSGVRALVLSAFGVGHVSEPVADTLEEVLAAGVLPVVASRTARGGTATRLYGFPGSESDLLARGVPLAGHLSGPKARLLVHVMLAAGASPDEVRAELAARGAA